MGNQKNKRGEGGFVFSTDPNFQPSDAFAALASLVTTPAPEKQVLRVNIEKKHRGGKTATVVFGFQGKEEDLEKLAKTLKTKLGVGGTAKNGEIVIQGELKDKVIQLLKTLGYTNTK